MPITATIKRDALVATGVTLFDVAAQGGGATAFNRAHHATLPTAQGIGVLLTIGEPGLTEDIRHFEPSGTHASEMRGWRRPRWRFNYRQHIERAGRGADRAGGDLQIARGRRQAAMSEQQLDGAHIGAGF